MALTVAFAWLLSHFVSAVFAGVQSASVIWALWLLLAVGAGRAALIWLQEWLSAIAGARAKAQLRARLLDALTALGPNWMNRHNTAEITLLATKQLDALDAYFSKFLPQLVYTAMVTPVFTAIIFASDFWSGVTVICTLPLIPLFMIFIGWATQGVQNQQLSAMNQLSRHFGEVLRGVTTLKVFGRLPHQPAIIAKTSDDYRRKTMKVLRYSFLSGLALEVAASLSVALIAVSIGLRLIDGSLQLETGLFVLLLAPEAYLPLRQVGAHFHASNEGVTASARALDIIDEAARSESAPKQPRANVATFRPGSITRITGVSGAGKTTAMNALREAIGAKNIAWLPQNVGLMSGSVRANIAAFAGTVDENLVVRAADIAGIGELNLAAEVGHGGSALSGGQAQRVGIARAVYRLLDTDCDWLLLDEPFAALDSARTESISSGIRRIARSGKTVVVISHQNFEGVLAEITASEVLPDA